MARTAKRPPSRILWAFWAAATFLPTPGTGLTPNASKVEWQQGSRLSLGRVNGTRRSLLTLWGVDAKRRKRAEEAIDKVKGVAPFVLLHTSGAGGSWLWQRLSVTPALCMLGYEPLADCGRDNSNLEKKLTWMRVALATPGGQTPAEKEARWASWRAKLEEKALPCRAAEVSERPSEVGWRLLDPPAAAANRRRGHVLRFWSFCSMWHPACRGGCAAQAKTSFEGRRCEAGRTFAAGFRLRVTKPLGRSEKWPALKATMWEFGAKVRPLCGSSEPTWRLVRWHGGCAWW